MTEIPANANLNNYTTVGSYYSPNASRSSTLSNSPVTTSGFNLHIESTSGSAGQFLLQTIKYNVAGIPKEWKRIYDGSTWNNWASSDDGVIALGDKLSNIRIMEYGFSLSSSGMHFKKMGQTGSGRFILFVNGTASDLNDIVHIFVTSNGTITIFAPNGTTASLTYTIDSDDGGFKISHPSKTNSITVTIISLYENMYFSVD